MVYNMISPFFDTSLAPIPWTIKKIGPLKIYLIFFFTVTSARVIFPKCYIIYFFSFFFLKKTKAFSFRTFRETCFGRILDRHYYKDTIRFRYNAILIRFWVWLFTTFNPVNTCLQNDVTLSPKWCNTPSQFLNKCW